MSIKKLLKKISSNNSVLYKLRCELMSFSFIENMVFHSKMDDEKYIKKIYKERFGVFPNLDSPKNFNEKNNWRKLHDRNALYTQMVDKYAIKGIIEERVGSNHTFRLLGVWDKPDEIDFQALPNQFVLKTNHAGGVIVCRDKNNLDIRETIKTLKKMQKVNYYVRSREWPYKNVEKKILAEEYMGENLIDYKNYSFGGKMMYTLVWKNHSRKDGLKPEAHFCGAYDLNWEKTSLDIDYPSDDVFIPKPECYDELKSVVESMSKGIPFVRVDCYIIDNKVYVGEMTFFPWGGFQKFKNESWNDYLGKLEKLEGVDY